LFLPWVSIPGLGSQNGLGGNAGFLLIASAAYMAFYGYQRMSGATMKKEYMIGLYVAAGLVLLVVLVNFFDSAFSFPGVSRGIGLWLTLVGMIVTVVAIVTVRKEDMAGTGSSGPPGTTPPSSPF
jgi:hypothetical protein